MHDNRNLGRTVRALLSARVPLRVRVVVEVERTAGAGLVVV